MKTKWSAFVLVLFSVNLAAQTSPAPQGNGEKAVAPKHYQMEFTVREVEGGKVVNGRSYSLMMSSDTSGTAAMLRTGSRVPYQTGTPTSMQYSYMEVGVNIDCRAPREHDGMVTLYVGTELTSVAPSPEGTQTLPPVLRQNKWGGDVIVPLRKPTIIFSSDDVASKRKMQVELTAIPIG